MEIKKQDSCQINFLFLYKINIYALKCKKQKKATTQPAIKRKNTLFFGANLLEKNVHCMFALDNQCSQRVIRRFCSDMEDLILRLVAKVVKPEAVRIRIDYALKQMLDKP